MTKKENYTELIARRKLEQEINTLESALLELLSLGKLPASYDELRAIQVKTDAIPLLTNTQKKLLETVLQLLISRISDDQEKYKANLQKFFKNIAAGKVKPLLTALAKKVDFNDILWIKTHLRVLVQDTEPVILSAVTTNLINDATELVQSYPFLSLPKLSPGQLFRTGQNLQARLLNTPTLPERILAENLLQISYIFSQYERLFEPRTAQGLHTFLFDLSMRRELRSFIKRAKKIIEKNGVDYLQDLITQIENHIQTELEKL